MTYVGIALITDGSRTYQTDAATSPPPRATDLTMVTRREYVVSTATIGGAAPRSLWRLSARLREDRVAAVHAACPGLAAVAARWVSMRTGLPLMASYYGDSDGSRYDKWLYGSCRRVIVPSEFARTSVLRGGWISHERLVLARAGVDTVMFSPNKRSSPVRESWRVSDKRPAILCIGPRSRHELDLLARIRTILDEYRRPHRFIVAAHGGTSDSWRKAVPDAVFIEDCDDATLAVVLASCDLFLSTRQASYPDPAGTLLMAQASGLPVIAPRCVGHHEAMLESITGHLCDPGSERDFAWRTAELLANAPRRAAMAVRATSYAGTRTSTPSSAALTQAYRDVVGLVANADEEQTASGVAESVA